MIRRIELAIHRWLSRRHERQQITKAVKALINDDAATALATANAESLIAAVNDRRPICRQCVNPFDHKPRPWADYVRLRAILMIPDREPDPIICDGCFEAAIGMFNPQATNIGTRNDGVPNLALRLLG